MSIFPLNDPDQRCEKVRKEQTEDAFLESIRSDTEFGLEIVPA